MGEAVQKGAFIIVALGLLVFWEDVKEKGRRAQGNLDGAAVTTSSSITSRQKSKDGTDNFPERK